MKAVIETGGKQYKVQPGEVVFVEKLNAMEGETVDFDVLMLSNDEGVQVGCPVLDGVKVRGKVVGQTKGPKILVFKYKSKKNYHRRAGHRQPYTKVEIVEVV